MFFPKATSACPDCKEPLVAFELEGVEIDRCLTCAGTWLDAGELAEIGGRAGLEPGGISKALWAAKASRRGKRRCPRCGWRLRVASIGAEPAVEIDRCPRGHGLWLDDGEMETIIASFEEGEEGEVARFFSDLYEKHIESKGLLRNKLDT